jgi:diguanylate cyclase (GGDEF)-like protein
VTARARAAALIADRTRAGVIVFGGILLIAVLDFISGVELRVFPLYYAPIALAAWVFGRRGSILAASAGAIGWFVANQLAGQQYSHPLIWFANTIVQAASFAIVGYLVAGLRLTLARERALSRTDPLSGLMNHRAFYEESARLLALCRRGRRPVTLAYLDLDDFKLVNDSQGHLAGDDLLRAVGQVLHSTLRSSDLTARLGGDEFAVLLPELSPAEAGQALHRLRDAISQVVGGFSSTVTVSIGAVTTMAPPDDVETMVLKADTVMYEAKRAGKNRLRLDVVPAMVSAPR